MRADMNRTGSDAMRTPALECSVDPRVFARYPSFLTGGFIAARLHRATLALTRGDLRAEFIRATMMLRDVGISPGNLTAVRAIQQWRRAFAACGIDPSVHPSSVESALRRFLHDGRIASRVPIVALCGAISARRIAPLHGCDMDTLPTSTIAIRPARPGSDWFVPLGARPTDTPLAPSVVVYAAGRAVLCWSFNQADSRQTCLSSDTRDAVFFTDALTADQASPAMEALLDLRNGLARRGALVGPAAFADITRPDIALTLNARAATRGPERVD